MQLCRNRWKKRTCSSSPASAIGISCSIAAIGALGDYQVEATFARVHLLQERRGGDGVRRWGPVADVGFGPPVVVGRGGVELELTTSELVDPEAGAFVCGTTFMVGGGCGPLCNGMPEGMNGIPPAMPPVGDDAMVMDPTQNENTEPNPPPPT